jgi:hypothetical protein
MVLLEFLNNLSAIDEVAEKPQISVTSASSCSQLLIAACTAVSSASLAAGEDLTP